MQGQGLERGEVIVSESLISQINYISESFWLSLWARTNRILRS